MFYTYMLYLFAFCELSSIEFAAPNHFLVIVLYDLTDRRHQDHKHSLQVRARESRGIHARAAGSL